MFLCFTIKAMAWQQFSNLGTCDGILIKMIFQAASVALVTSFAFLSRTTFIQRGELSGKLLKPRCIFWYNNMQPCCCQWCCSLTGTFARTGWRRACGNKVVPAQREARGIMESWLASGLIFSVSARYKYTTRSKMSLKIISLTHKVQYSCFWVYHCI